MGHIKDNNIPEEIQKIIDAQLAGEKVSSDDMREFLKWSKGLDKAEQEDIKSNEPDTFDAMGALMSELADNPKYTDLRKTIKTSKILSDAFNITSDLVGLGVSIDQVKTSKRELAKLKEPRTPGTIGRSPQLRAALDRSFRDLASPISDIAPVFLQNLDNFRQNIGIAKTAASGQAGVFGSLGQLAVNQRRRGNIEAIPAIQSIRRQQQAQQAGLLGLDLSERNLIQGQQFKNFESNIGQFNLRQGAAGRLGAVGRQNVLESIQRLGQDLPGTLAPVVTAFGNANVGGRQFNLNPFTSDINAKRLPNRQLDTTKTTGFDFGDIDSFADNINSSLFGRFIR